MPLKKWTNSRRQTRTPQPAPVLEPLEPRLLLSADVLGAALPDNLAAGQADQAIVAMIDEEVAASIDGLVAYAADDDNVASASYQRELIIVDAGVPDTDALLADLYDLDHKRFEVVLLDAGRNGVVQLSEILGDRRDLDAVHLIAHGAAGEIRLGNTTLGQATLTANAESVIAWGESFSDRGDLLVYGCNLSATAEGKTFINTLAALTGADVAASDDPSGDEDLGGDWELEHETGRIEVNVAFSNDVQQNWNHLLAGTNFGTAIWRNDGDSTPEANEWNGVNFAGATGTANMGEWRIVEAAEAPTRDEIIAVGVDNWLPTVGRLNGQIWDGTNWTALPFTLPNSSDNMSQSFAVAYESQSGDALLVWDNGAGGTGSVSYRVWDGTDWSAEQTITAPDAGWAQQLRLAASPTSDEMVLVVSDNDTDEWVAVWDGSSWGDTAVLNTATTTDRNEIAVAYESQSGYAMVVYDATGNSSDLSYRTWDGTTWSGQQTLTTPSNPLIETDAEFATLAADPTSDRIAIGVVAGGTQNEIWFAVWDGAAWGDKLLATTTAWSGNKLDAAVGFESQSGTLMATYAEVATTPRYQTWSSGSGWSGELNAPDIGAYGQAMTLAADPAGDALMLGIQDDQSDLHYIPWSGTAWGCRQRSVDQHR